MRGALCLLAAGACILAPPALVSADQTVTLKDSPISGGKLLEIRGDDEPDLVTLEYDAITDEYVIGHDILDPIPPECRRVKFQEIRCPAKDIVIILISTGNGSDTVRVTPSIASKWNLYLSVNLGDQNDKFEGGSETTDRRLSKQTAGTMKVVGGNGSDKATLGPGADTFIGGAGADKAFLGAGKDFAAMGGGSDKAYGGPGADTIKGGGASDKIFGQGGNDQCDDGPGSGKEISC